MKFDGAIFDLDGTLVNSLEDLADSMNGVLTAFHFPVHELDEYKTFVGNGMRNLVTVSLPEASRDARTIDGCYDLMVKTYRGNFLNKTKPYDGVPGLLGGLKRRGMKLGVLSNKGDDMTKTIVGSLFPGFFDIVLGLRDESRKKPDPSGALEIAGHLGVPPEKMLYVGDSNVDMLTANNAGMFAAGASWGYRTREELLASGAGCVLEKPMDLLDIIE